MRKSKIERLQKYYAEGRGDWWFYPLWKQILYCIAFPFIMIWMCICWCIMQIGKWIFRFGDLLSGWRWNEGNWLEDV